MKNKIIDKIIDTEKVMTRMILINALLCMMLSLSNIIYIKNTNITMFVYGMEFVILTICIPTIIVHCHNDKIISKNLEKCFKDMIDSLEKELKGLTEEADKFKKVDDNNEQVGSLK